jgi:TetR/AcrR family transcriptional regulator, regulator of cefoperazone and chloramphenicol sensitivity
MPRDGSETRVRLLREAERLFATRGVYQATVREIVQAAGQRNTSALSYHFGSREQVLEEILLRHGDPLDVERGDLVTEPIDEMPTRALVAALLVPYGGCLATPEGRDYVRIVAQLTDRFAAWRYQGALTPPNLSRILQLLEDRAGGDTKVRRERVVNAIMLLTAAIAERARSLDEGPPVEFDHHMFLDNLADMIVGGLEAPVGAPLSAVRS